MIKNTSKNGEYVSILITMKQQQFRNYYARYIEDTMMSILETWTLNDFEENQETLFYDAGIFKRYECIATNSQLNKNYLRVC